MKHFLAALHQILCRGDGQAQQLLAKLNAPDHSAFLPALLPTDLFDCLFNCHDSERPGFSLQRLGSVRLRSATQWMADSAFQLAQQVLKLFPAALRQVLRRNDGQA